MQTELKSVLDSIASSMGDFKTRLDNVQSQTDAIDKRMVDRSGFTGAIVSGTKAIADKLRENDDVARLLRNRKGAAIITFSGDDYARLFERKTTITSSAVGSATSGVLQIDRTPGIVQEARQALMVRDVFTARPTNLQLVDFVKVNAAMTIASPQTEASDKAQNAVTFSTASERVRTLATWIPASRQILDDFDELAGFIDSSLSYYVNLAEELQLLAGDNTGENLNGLIPQATDFDTSLLPASDGWNKIDIVGLAQGQLAAAKELTPTFVIVNTNDWVSMRLLKDSLGRYILGDPQANVTPALFNMKVIPTTSIAAGTFLIGSGDATAAEIRDRQEMTVDLSTEHSDYFVKNLVAVRAEKRLALVTKRPAAFVTGSFTSSPA